MGPPRTNDQPVNDLYVIHNLTRGLTLATHVALAGTSEARRRGLLDAENLDAGAGLWIVPARLFILSA